MSQDLEQLAPPIFAIARHLRDQGGQVRILNIRTGVDDNGDGGQVVAGRMPADFDPPDNVLTRSGPSFPPPERKYR